MVSNEQMKDNLMKIYSRYLENKEDNKNRKKAYKIYLEYSPGANTIFSKDVGGAIWSSFELSEGKLSKKEAQKILEDLNKS